MEDGGSRRRRSLGRTISHACHIYGYLGNRSHLQRTIKLICCHLVDGQEKGGFKKCVTRVFAGSLWKVTWCTNLVGSHRQPTRLREAFQHETQGRKLSKSRIRYMGYLNKNQALGRRTILGSCYLEIANTPPSLIILLANGPSVSSLDVHLVYSSSLSSNTRVLAPRPRLKAFP